MEECGFYEIDDLNEETISFSLLSTAIGYETILDFVSSTKDPFIDREKLKPDAIRHLVSWMYEANEMAKLFLESLATSSVLL